MILAGILSHISRLRGVEEMRVGRLDTTIYGRDPKDWEGTQAANMKGQYK